MAANYIVVRERLCGSSGDVTAAIKVWNWPNNGTLTLAIGRFNLHDRGESSGAEFSFSPFSRCRPLISRLELITHDPLPCLNMKFTIQFLIWYSIRLSPFRGFHIGYVVNHIKRFFSRLPAAPAAAYMQVYVTLNNNNRGVVLQKPWGGWRFEGSRG